MEEKNNGVQGFEGSGVQGEENTKPGAKSIAQIVEGVKVDQAELTDQTNQERLENGITLENLKAIHGLLEESGVIDLSEEQVGIMDQMEEGFKKRLEAVFPSEKKVFSADLVMTAIRNTQHGVTFEVQNPEGFRITGLTHVQMDRKSFPVDDDFNMSFINAPFKEPKELVVKRDGFRKYTKMRLVILMEE